MSRRQIFSRPDCIKVYIKFLYVAHKKKEKHMSIHKIIYIYIYIYITIRMYYCLHQVFLCCIKHKIRYHITIKKHISNANNIQQYLEMEIRMGLRQFFIQLVLWHKRYHSIKRSTALRAVPRSKQRSGHYVLRSSSPLSFTAL